MNHDYPQHEWGTDRPQLRDWLIEGYRGGVRAPHEPLPVVERDERTHSA